MNNKDLGLPRFDRELMRPEEIEARETGKQIWFPTWKCFCCHDTGFVNSRLVKLVIPNYNHDEDKLPICQNLSCDQHQQYSSSTIISSSLDWRFGDEICQKLDAIEREEWRLERDRTIKQLNKLNVIDFAKERSLRRGDRSRLEQEQVDINNQTERDC